MDGTAQAACVAEPHSRLHRLTAEFQVLGLSNKAARQAARKRFGWRNHRRLALKEIGGDWADW